MFRAVVVAVLVGMLGCNKHQESPLPTDVGQPVASLGTAEPETQIVQPIDYSPKLQHPEAALPSFFTSPEGKNGLYSEEQLKLQEQYTKQQADIKRRLQRINGEYDPPLRNVNSHRQTNHYFRIESSTQPAETAKPE